MEKTVKIIKDTVSHRIEIGSIVKIKVDDYKIRKGKKCYNLVDYANYISIDDFEIVNQLESSDWFDDYAKNFNPVPKYSKGQRVKVRNILKLEPNGKVSNAPDGVYTIYETKDKKGYYWFRTNNINDVDEYFCTNEDNIKLE